MAASGLMATGLSWVAVWAITAVLAAALYPLFGRSIQGAPAADRALCLLLYGLLPVLVASLVALLLAFPQLTTFLVPAHCHHHDCGPHRPEMSPTYAASGLAALAVAVAVGTALVWQRRVSRHGRQLRTLARLSRRNEGSPYQVIDSPHLLAWCAGLFRQQILISQGLLDRLSPDELNEVIAHERVHVARRDNLRKMVLELASLPWPRPCRRQLRTDFAAATEDACNAIVACRREVRPSGDETDSQSTSAKPAHFAVSNRIAGWLLLAALWLGEVVVLTGITHFALEWIGR